MSPSRLDVLCFGEALVDFLPDRRGRLRDCERFEAHSGGAPANVAVGIARLGLRAGFCGVVGDDEFGRLLERKLRAEGVETSLRFSGAARTGVWFVALDRRGDRTFFSPSGTHGADKLISEVDVRRAPIARSRWLHCGTSSHVLPSGQRALLSAVRRARRLGVRISFDPNVRVHLWRDLRDLRELCKRVFPSCDVAKLSREEAETCTGESDPHKAAASLVSRGVKLACITLGPEGAYARQGNREFRLSAPRVRVVDTTGAGDGFVAGLLSRLPENDPGSIPDTALQAALAFACAVGSRVCTRLGAVAGLPGGTFAPPRRQSSGRNG
ncbi:MAG: carbohydrate kinase [Deltaproteobacteria bacterium]|nr:MAG: carbohydrate kinase [Deltaproteobacteria bacterium]TMB39399.1 MAG: carbohydrate kinase [Deltaproteobacteria bacterium]